MRILTFIERWCIDVCEIKSKVDEALYSTNTIAMQC